jgi:hypothetical protein
MRKLILPILLGFVLIAILGIVGSVSAQSAFEVAVYTNYGDSAIVKTKATNDTKGVSLLKDGKPVNVVARWSIFIAPKVPLSVGMVKQFNCYLLEDGSIISIPRDVRHVEKEKIVQLDSIMRARRAIK